MVMRLTNSRSGGILGVKPRRRDAAVSREAPTPQTVKVAHAKAHLSELLAKVERGEEFVIARGARPIARLAPLEDAARGRAAVEAMLRIRDSGDVQRVTQAEIRAWIREGRRET
jgi:prevent-host-death family protein